MTAPNREPVLDTDGIHAIEHLGAVYLRNHQEWRTRLFTSDRWGVEPVFISFSMEI